MKLILIVGRAKSAGGFHSETHFSTNFCATRAARNLWERVTRIAWSFAQNASLARRWQGASGQTA